MKRVLLSIIFYVSVSAYGQTSVYHPFPDSGAVWIEMYGTGHSNLCCCSGGPCVEERYFQHFLRGDTVIGINSYKKICKSGRYRWYISGPPTCPPWCTGNWAWNYFAEQYVGAIRQDTSQRKVFFVPSSASSEALLYDFNLNPGDTLPPSYINYNYPNNIISSIDSILIGNNYHKKYNISTPGAASLIEGIGSTFGLLYSVDPPFEFTNTLLCVIIDSSNVYPDSLIACLFETGAHELLPDNNYLLISPNPTTNQLTIENGKWKMENVEVFDVIGKRMIALPLNPLKGTFAEINVSGLSAGIYFVRVKTEKGVANKKFVKQ
jgi:hypothetical protein